MRMKLLGLGKLMAAGKLEDPLKNFVEPPEDNKKEQSASPEIIKDSQQNKEQLNILKEEGNKFIDKSNTTIQQQKQGAAGENGRYLKKLTKGDSQDSVKMSIHSNPSTAKGPDSYIRAQRIYEPKQNAQKPGVIIEVENAPEDEDTREKHIVQDTSILHTDLLKRPSTPPSEFNKNGSSSGYNRSASESHYAREESHVSQFSNLSPYVKKNTIKVASSSPEIHTNQSKSGAKHTKMSTVNKQKTITSPYQQQQLQLINNNLISKKVQGSTQKKQQTMVQPEKINLLLSNSPYRNEFSNDNQKNPSLNIGQGHSVSKKQGNGTSYNVTRMSSGKLFMQEMAEAIDFNHSQKHKSQKKQMPPHNHNNNDDFHDKQYYENDAVVINLEGITQAVAQQQDNQANSSIEMDKSDQEELAEGKNPKGQIKNLKDNWNRMHKVYAVSRQIQKANILHQMHKSHPKTDSSQQQAE